MSCPCVEVRGLLLRMSSLSSGHQAWQQVPLPTEPSHQHLHLSSSKLSQAVLAHPKVLGAFLCLLVTVIFPSEYFYLVSYCLFVIYLLSSEVFKLYHGTL